jgi:tetratricopeptide (TPR) repeat protein
LKGQVRQFCCGLLLAIALPAQESFPEMYERALDLERASAPQPRLRSAYSAALRAFLRLPVDAPETAAFISQAGRSAVLAGRYPMALELLGEALAKTPDDEFLRRWWLEAQLGSGAYELVVGRAREWDQAQPEMVLAFLRGADGSGRQELLEAAGSWLRRGETDLGLWLFARTADTGNPLAQANHGLALRNLGRLGESEQVYKRALDGAPQDAILWNDYGLLLKGSDRPGEAWEAFQKSFSLDVDVGQGPATTNLLLLMRNGGRSWSRADASLQSLLRLRPQAALPRRLAIDRILAEK